MNFYDLQSFYLEKLLILFKLEFTHINIRIRDVCECKSLPIEK